MPKPDEGHLETEEIIQKIADETAEVYRQASEEVQEKLDDYLRRFKTKDEKWQIMVYNGEQHAAELAQWQADVLSGAKTAAEFEAWKTENHIRTPEEYAEWRQNQIIIGDKWAALQQQLAEDYHNANNIARSIANGYMPDVYAINMNYGTYQVEMTAHVGTSFTLYNRQTVERLIKDNPDLLPPPGRQMNRKIAEAIAAGRDIRWQKGQIQSVMLQSILQGESIPKISKRIAETMGEKNHAATIRYARTAATGAQNAGRVDSYKRAQKMGIKLRQAWMATLDGRTRYEHRQLDGQTVDVGEKFSNGCRYPGDPEGPPEEIWNCRCTTVVELIGFEDDFADLSWRDTVKMEEQTYEEWKANRGKSQPITAQESRGRKAKAETINRYYKGV